jgi:hypothetical protein
VTGGSFLDLALLHVISLANVTLLSSFKSYPAGATPRMVAGRELEANYRHIISEIIIITITQILAQCRHQRYDEGCK